MAQSNVSQGTESQPRKGVRNGKTRACAECKRLKLRCDKSIPCQSCIRRGCTALCPDKCFTEETSPSSLKASSLRNSAQIEYLKHRVVTLEKALAVTHPTHTLLEQGDIHSSSRSLSAISDTAVESDAVGQTIDIFGSLSIGEDGSPVYHGATSMSEHFVQKSVPGETDRRNLLLTGDQPILPSSLQLLSALFPFTPQMLARNSDINEMLPYLPPAAEALEITNRYWHHLSMGCAPISRIQFMKQIFSHFYPNNMMQMHLIPADAHRLGVLFITLALGVLTDLTKPMLSTEAEKYHQLARASLSLDPICDNTTIHGLQCMLSISWYVRAAPTRTTTGYMWAIGGVLLKLGSSIGIFRDSRKWLTDIDEIEQREVVCWELLCMEVGQSFTAGRPSSVNFSLVDCQRPPESATASAGLSGFIPGFADWRYRLHPIINNVLLVVQRPGPVKYSEIRKLEHQIRQCALPEGLFVPPMSSPDQGLPQDAITKHLQRFTALFMKESALCMLHRRFLVLAMQGEADEPTKTPFWYSAYTAGYSACWIVKAHVVMYHRHPELLSRVPAFWSTSFSAAVVLGAIAARYWNRDFAQGTLRPFEQICTLFEEAAGTSIQPLNALEILQRLRQRVQAKFPTSSDAARNFNDLPLLGAQPSIPTSTLDQNESNITFSVPSEDLSPFLTGGIPSSLSPSTPESSEGTAMAATGQTPNYISEVGLDAVWSAPDLKLFHDSNGGGVPFPWPDGQVLQPSLPEGLRHAPMENFMPGVAQSTTEAGLWNQFLDRLGVWE